VPKNSRQQLDYSSSSTTGPILGGERETTSSGEQQPTAEQAIEYDGVQQQQLPDEVNRITAVAAAAATIEQQGQGHLSHQQSSSGLAQLAEALAAKLGKCRRKFASFSLIIFHISSVPKNPRIPPMATNGQSFGGENATNFTDQQEPQQHNVEQDGEPGRRIQFETNVMETLQSVGFSQPDAAEVWQAMDILAKHGIMVIVESIFGIIINWQNFRISQWASTWFQSGQQMPQQNNAKSPHPNQIAQVKERLTD
jgi:hypothetical protein